MHEQMKTLVLEIACEGPGNNDKLIKDPCMQGSSRVEALGLAWGEETHEK